MSIYSDRGIFWWLLIGWLILCFHLFWLLIKFSIVAILWIIAFPIMLAARF